MNMPIEGVLEVRTCALGPASVFAAWNLGCCTIGLWRERYGENPIELGDVEDLDYHIWNYGPAFLMRKPAAGKWEPLVVQEKKGGRKYICYRLAHVLTADGKRGKFVFFLFDAERDRKIEKTPLKLRQEFNHCFEVAKATAAALG